MSNPSPLIPLTGPRERGRKRPRALGVEQRAREQRLWEARVVGRAWINGREVGGPDARFAHLAGSYD